MSKAIEKLISLFYFYKHFNKSFKLLQILVLQLINYF